MMYTEVKIVCKSFLNPLENMQCNNFKKKKMSLLTNKHHKSYQKAKIY